MEAKKTETITGCAAPKELHIAPMLATSNREFRALFRILSKRATLWTEMVVDSTLFYNLTKNNGDDDPLVPPEHLLDPCTPADHPVICQIGGIRPEWTAVAARAVAAAGYDCRMINLNLDCPSPRVQGRQFGAVLMQHPARVVALLRAMVRGAQAAAHSQQRSINPWWFPSSVASELKIRAATTTRRLLPRTGRGWSSLCRPCPRRLMAWRMMLPVARAL